MIHQYKNNGYNIVLDVNSGSVHVVDDMVYDIIGLAAVFIPVAVFLGFRNQELVAALIMLASPTTVTSYVMAKSMDNDEVLSSSIIVLTTVLSSITLTGWIFILRALGLI